MLPSGWYQSLLSGFGDGKPSEVVEAAVVQRTRRRSKRNHRLGVTCKSLGTSRCIRIDSNSSRARLSFSGPHRFGRRPPA